MANTHNISDKMLREIFITFWSLRDEISLVLGGDSVSDYFDILKEECIDMMDSIDIVRNSMRTPSHDELAEPEEEIFL